MTKIAVCFHFNWKRRHGCSAALPSVDADREAQTNAGGLELLLVFLKLVMHRDSRLVTVWFAWGMEEVEQDQGMSF